MSAAPLRPAGEPTQTPTDALATCDSTPHSALYVLATEEGPFEERLYRAWDRHLQHTPIQNVPEEIRAEIEEVLDICRQHLMACQFKPMSRGDQAYVVDLLMCMIIDFARLD